MTTPTPLWTPTQSEAQHSNMAQLMRLAADRHGAPVEDYSAFHGWSVSNAEDFWSLVWDECGVVGDKGERALVDGDKMPGAQFFPDARLNFAENLLAKGGDGDAIVFRGEDKLERRVSWAVRGIPRALPWRPPSPPK